MIPAEVLAAFNKRERHAMVDVYSEPKFSICLSQANPPDTPPMRPGTIEAYVSANYIGFLQGDESKIENALDAKLKERAVEYERIFSDRKIL